MNILNIPLTYSETALLLRLLKDIADSNTIKELNEANISLSDFVSLLEKTQQLDNCFTGKEIPF